MGPNNLGKKNLEIFLNIANHERACNGESDHRNDTGERGEVRVDGLRFQNGHYQEKIKHINIF